MANSRLRDRAVYHTDLLNEMRSAMPDVEFVDIGAMQCTPECNVVENSRLLYIDERHFTSLGALRVGEQFRKSFDLPGFIDGEAP